MVWTGGSSKRFCTCVASQPTARPTQTAARGHEQKLQARLRQRKGASHDGGDSETEGDKGSGVVDQAFAFEDDNNLARHAQMLSDRERRHGVRRRDDVRRRQNRPPKAIRPGSATDKPSAVIVNKDQNDGEREN